MPHYGRIVLRPWRQLPLRYPRQLPSLQPLHRQQWRNPADSSRGALLPPTLNYRCYSSASAFPSSTASANGNTAIAPVTAVNAPPSVPEHLRPLYQALEGLKTHAGSYVNISRLQLALAGLKSEKPALRVALFGTAGTDSPRKLARLLLADSLKEEEGWEREVVDDQSGNAVVIRYGEPSDIVPPRSAIPTTLSSSRVLRDQRLEILVSNLDILRPSTSDTPTDAILVPAVETRTSTTGLTSLITYPVHRAIVVLENLDDVLNYARYVLAQDSRDLPPEMVKIVVNMKERGIDPGPAGNSSSITMVNPEIALSGLKSIRESVANAPEATQLLNASNLTSLSDWLTNDSSSTSLDPTIHTLITSLLSDTLHTINTTPSTLSPTSSPPIDSTTLNTLHQALSTWSAQAHAHHQSALPHLTTLPLSRLSSPLLLLLPLRIDDVRWILEDAVSRHYLVQPEKELIYLTAQLTRLGLMPEVPILSEAELNAQARRMAWSDSEAGAQGKSTEVIPDTPSETPRTSLLPPSTNLTAATSFATLESLPLPQLPTTTHSPHHLTNPLNLPPLSRTHLLHAIPSLHRRAQSLLTTFLTTTFLTTSLGALSYVSFASVRATDAVVIAGLGAVVAARRFVRGWEGWVGGWERSVKEEGRRYVGMIEGVVRERLEKGGREMEGKGEGEDGEVRRAREAVEGVGRELEMLRERR
ncbi:hypothetical protein P152DRAFT_501863 [Eremomyces bilateralis CBS 781.70]|uniref:Mmc1 C-terminal domain-containing protein n=1 Tax=Eremomyces bilateralis CBS 781.70 TaxID=1392243 RepID=A0A6G1G7P8_9PEZI|nr:uncharacterized protein P152DRAFT_501863 [Eremomyces bilateralis CBS 781.70]KAF1814032.1 hypothetical protein P152DRAFT_501863 [Eremomyces bilateralis CBS 781.70]